VRIDSGYSRRIGLPSSGGSFTHHLEGIAGPAGCDGECADLRTGNARGAADAGADEEGSDFARHCEKEIETFARAAAGGRGSEAEEERRGCSGGGRFEALKWPYRLPFGSWSRPMRLELACKMGDGDWLGRVKSGEWAHCVYFPHRWKTPQTSCN
jgi:hypothetical protein